MKRAVLMALGIGAVLTSAAAFSIGAATNLNTPLATDDLTASSLGQAHVERRAREAQRAGIESRYLADRARCGALGGLRRDQCFIDAHATRGLSMMAAAAPYESRFQD